MFLIYFTFLLRILFRYVLEFLYIYFFWYLPSNKCIFGKIFSHSVGWLFVWMMVPFAIQNLFSFLRSYSLPVCIIASANSVLFSFFSSASEFKNVLSSFKFSVSGFMLTSSYQLELNFLQDNKYESVWVLLDADGQADQNYL